MPGFYPVTADEIMGRAARSVGNDVTLATPIPPRVEAAIALARELGFPLTRDEAPDGRPTCSLPGVGRLLAMLAAACTGRAPRIGEIGSGTGVGAAWMASAMPPGATLVTVELDDARAAAVQRLFGDDPRITVVQGDANDVMPRHAPFDLLFVDGGIPATAGDTLVELVRIGGQLVVDDVTPTRRLDAASPFQSNDPKRALFFASPRLQSVEIVLPDLENAAFVATRVI
jgi:predicted O-methyltransferase YrrM